MHTFATLQLYNRTDIYTLSKMLGHKNLKTTQVYTEIVDEAKRNAANKIRFIRKEGSISSTLINYYGEQN